MQQDWRLKFLYGFLVFMLVYTLLVLMSSVILPILGSKLEPGAWKLVPWYTLALLGLTAGIFICANSLKKKDFRFLKLSVLMLTAFAIEPVKALLEGRGSAVFLSLVLALTGIGLSANLSLLLQQRKN